MKITLNYTLDLQPQLHLHVKLSRAEGRTEADIIEDLLDTFDYTDEEISSAYQEGLDEGYAASPECACAEKDSFILLNLNEHTGNDLHDAINRFRNAISEDRPEELSHCTYGLRRATALYQLSTAKSRRSMATAISNMSTAFGTPGNFGYDSKAGKSLLTIYMSNNEEIDAYLIHRASLKTIDPEPEPLER